MYFKTSETKAIIDPDKISEEILRVATSGGIDHVQVESIKIRIYRLCIEGK